MSDDLVPVIPDDTKVITTHEAQIETLQVSVQVVRIGPKQMTLAVFRQLPYEDLVRGVRFVPAPELWPFTGILWGRVQYYWPGCQSDSLYEETTEPHTHVIWQEEGILYRSCVPSALPNCLVRPQKDAETLRRLLWPQWQELFARVMASPQLFIAV